MIDVLKSNQLFYSPNIYSKLNRKAKLPYDLLDKRSKWIKDDFITETYLYDFTHPTKTNTVNLDELSDNQKENISQRRDVLYTWFEDTLIENVRILKNLIAYQRAIEKIFSIGEHDLWDILNDLIHLGRDRLTK